MTTTFRRTALSVVMGSLLGVAAGCQTGPKYLTPFGGEAKYLSNIRQITFEKMGFDKAGEAYFDPKSDRIIFQAVPKGKELYQIYVMDLNEGVPRMVSTGVGYCTCSYFHPKEDKIIFASTHLGPDAERLPPGSEGGRYSWDYHPALDIFEADPDGSNLKRLTTTTGYDAEGTYSPDGTKIVFNSRRTGDNEIFVMDADGSDPKRLTFTEGDDGGPFFSPDQSRILYRADHIGDGNLQLRIMNADGSGDRAINPNNVFNWCPSWHPSGESIIFTRADHGAPGGPNYDLYMITPEGEPLIRITHDGSFDGLPIFSPDGSRLMWTSKRGGLSGAQIFLADFTLPAELR